MDKLTATKYFIKVADTGSFSKTAKNLNLPISTVSRRIKDLEQHLGVELLRRTTRYLALTESGKIYYDQVAPAVQSFEMADQLLKESSSELSGKLTISALPSYANKHLYPMLEKFRMKYPEIIIELICTTTLQDIIKDNIDFIIRPTHSPPDHLVAKVIDNHNMAIVATPKYLADVAPITHWDTIQNHKAICYATESGIMSWYAYQNDTFHEINKNPYVIYSDTCKVLDSVLNNEGIALLPEWTYHESLEAGEVQIVNKDWQGMFKPSLDQKLYILYDKKTSKLKRNQTFLKFFLDQIK